MFQSKGKFGGVLGYVLGGALFLLALGVSTGSPWFRNHYPYLAYFIAALATCYFAGILPAVAVALASAAAVYFTFAPAGFFVSATQTPVSAAIVVLLLLLAAVAVLGGMQLSSRRLIAERERYHRLADSRDLLYRELQHRVSNNIQIISGILLLQSQAVGDRGARRALAEASSRIGLIGRIQRQLAGQGGAPQPFRRFAEELLADAVAASGVAQVEVRMEGGETPLHPEQATPVSLVMLECVNNALEHAFEGAGGAVRVSLETTDGQRALTVADDGRGLPDGFDPQTGKTLGLKIVHAMAAQIGGRFSIEPGHPGAICRLVFPRLD